MCMCLVSVMDVKEEGNLMYRLPECEVGIGILFILKGYGVDCAGVGVLAAAKKIWCSAD